MDSVLYKDFHNLVVNEVPLIDVRAPIEYEKGAFKPSVNLPIMNNEERHLVGIQYKKKGDVAATELGYQLVSGEVKEERIQAWKTYLEQHPDAMMYCFRGGSRSQIAQQWIEENLKLSIPRLEGGYKAFRNYLIEALEPASISVKPIILGGYTGSGKTILLNRLQNQIDLEGIANHRGSSFGRHVTEQPSQIDFENNLAYTLIQKQAKGYKHIILEDESRNIGRCFLPKPFYEYIRNGDLVIIEQEMEYRVKIILDEYVVASQKEHIETTDNVEEGMNQWFEYIVGGMVKLRKRFGVERVQILVDAVQKAFDKQLLTGSVTDHENWIHMCLKEYYDPMYQYQIENTTKNIIFRGNENEVFEFLKQKQ